MRLIDADALKFPAMKGSFNEIDLSRMDGYSKAIQIVRNAPTIDAAPVVHAEWMHARYTKEPIYLCSNCYVAEYKQHNYCHNCGARMDKGRKYEIQKETSHR